MELFSLYINPAKISRQTTREQWRQIDRYRRVAQRESRKVFAKPQNWAALWQGIADLMTYGTSKVRIDL